MLFVLLQRSWFSIKKTFTTRMYMYFTLMAAKVRSSLVDVLDFAMRFNHF